MAFPEQQWLEAKKRCKLNAEDIRIAKEMGLNPKSLIKNIPTKQQQWKTPVHDWLREMWADRQEKSRQKQLKKQKALDSAGNLDSVVPVQPANLLVDDSWFDYLSADESCDLGGFLADAEDICNPMLDTLTKLDSSVLAEALMTLAKESPSAQMVVERLTADNERKIELFKDNLRTITNQPESGGISGHMMLNTLKRTLELLDPQTMPAELGLELVEAFYYTDTFALNSSTDSEPDCVERMSFAGSAPERMQEAQGYPLAAWDDESYDASNIQGISWDVDAFHLEFQLLYEEAAFDMFVAFARTCTNPEHVLQVLNRLSADDRYGVRSKLFLEAATFFPQSYL